MIFFAIQYLFTTFASHFLKKMTLISNISELFFFLMQTFNLKN